jgi:hypothetical protein
VPAIPASESPSSFPPLPHLQLPLSLSPRGCPSENGKRSCLRTTKNVKKSLRFEGDPLAGFYLTPLAALT